MSAFSVKLMKEELNKRDLNSRWAHHFTENITIEGYFDNLVNALQKLVPVAEDSDVKLMIHTEVSARCRLDFQKDDHDEKHILLGLMYGALSISSKFSNLMTPILTILLSNSR
jgi:hypothetical protein